MMKLLSLRTTSVMTSGTVFSPFFITTIQTYTFCLVLTIIVELTVARSLGIKSKQALMIVVAAQIFTNPIAVFITSACMDLISDSAQYYGCVIAVELTVIVVEGLIYKYKGVSRAPWGLSILCNLASVSVGILVQILI